MERGGRAVVAVLASANSSYAQQTIRVADHSGRGIEILDDAAAHGIPDLGKTTNIEWTQFQAPRR